MTGFSESVMEDVLSDRGFDIRPMNQDATAEQQRAADTFKSLGLIPVAINVADAVHKQQP